MNKWNETINKVMVKRNIKNDNTITNTVHNSPITPFTSHPSRGSLVSCNLLLQWETFNSSKLRLLSLPSAAPYFSMPGSLHVEEPYNDEEHKGSEDKWEVKKYNARGG